MSETAIKPRWRDSEYASHYFTCEQAFLDSGLRQSVGPSVLQVGDYLEQSVVDSLDLPFLVMTQPNFDTAVDVAIDPAFMPFEPNSFATVLLPHVLEGHTLPHQVLREAHRALMPEGHLVITGFNPISFIGLQRLFRSKSVCDGRYYTVKRVIDWLQLLGFDIVASSMFQYSPLLKRAGVRKSLHFLEAVGDRWLPMTGGGYMISAKKRELGNTMVGRVRFKPAKAKVGAPAGVSTRLKPSEKAPNKTQL